MATERIALGINLRKNKITGNTGYGKYYPEVDVQKTLTTRGFAQHLVNHGSRWNRGELENVLYQIAECLPELVAQGVPIKLGNLGTFYPTAEVAEDAGVPDIAAMESLNPNDLVKGIHIRFLPDQTKLDNLSGPAFKEACSLELRNIVDTEAVVINGKTRKVQTLKPIATAVAELRAGTVTPTPGGNGGNTGGNTGGDNGGGDGGGDDLDI